jgi:RNA polymerase sigma-70 factor, ECF subfamily
VAANPSPKFRMSANSFPFADHEARTQQFVRLLSIHEQELSGYVVSLVPNWADADEIIQETKLRLWTQFDEYDPTKNFGGWARAIAYFMVLAYRERSQRTAARFSQEFIDTISREAESLAVEAFPLRQALSNCIAKLSQSARELLWACYAGKETIKDVAIRLGRSVRGTQRTVAQIRIDLQRCIEDAMRREESR